MRIASHTAASGKHQTVTRSEHHQNIPLGTNGGERKTLIHLRQTAPVVEIRPLSCSTADPHRNAIEQLLIDFDGNISKARHALCERGVQLPYSTMSAFCRRNDLVNKSSNPVLSFNAAQHWLSRFQRDAKENDRLKTRLGADLGPLLVYLKHGRARHRKKAATILARTRGIPNLDALDHFNEVTLHSSDGPILELVPLPTSAQSLNVVEGVLSGMTRAVVDNSDYPSADEMKQAISRHLVERNEHFQNNPKRAGKKIWDLDFFHDVEAFRAGDYREW